MSESGAFCANLHLDHNCAFPDCPESRSGSPLEATTEAVASRSALYSAPTGDKKNLAADTTYIPKGWDRPMYRAPDEVLFEVRAYYKMKPLGASGTNCGLACRGIYTITLGVGYRVCAMQWQELVCCLKFMEDKEVRE